MAYRCQPDPLVELECVGGDQRNSFEIHSAGKVPKEGAVCCGSSDSRRLSKARVETRRRSRREDPDRLFFAPDNRFDLVC